MPFWESSAFWGIVGVVGVALGIFASAFFSNRKVLTYNKESSVLITDDISNIPRLAVTMDSRPIQNLIATEIKFYNAGNQTIISSDLAKLEPLGVFIPNAYFGSKISSDNKNSAPIINTINEHTLAIEFDFIKPGESLTLCVWHDGDLSICGDLYSGKLKEGRKERKLLSLYVSIIGTCMLFLFLLSVLLEMLILAVSGKDISLLTLRNIFSCNEFIIAWYASSLIVVIPLVYRIIMSQLKKVFD